MVDLSSNVLAFSKLLDREYGFELGHADVRDALEAIHATGIESKRRFRYALRMVYCSKSEQLGPFDRAFDRFFGNEVEGQRQPRMPQTRAGDEHHTQPAARREIQDD